MVSKEVKEGFCDFILDKRNDGLRWGLNIEEQFKLFLSIFHNETVITKI